jgi:hypothetical protein
MLDRVRDPSADVAVGAIESDVIANAIDRKAMAVAADANRHEEATDSPPEPAPRVAPA